MEMVFTVFRLLTDFVCLYTYEFWLSLWKIVRSSVILLFPLCTWWRRSFYYRNHKWYVHIMSYLAVVWEDWSNVNCFEYFEAFVRDNKTKYILMTTSSKVGTQYKMFTVIVYSYFYSYTNCHKMGKYTFFRSSLSN